MASSSPWQSMEIGHMFFFHNILPIKLRKKDFPHVPSLLVSYAFTKCFSILLIAQEASELLQYIYSCKSLHERNLLKATAYASHGKPQAMKLPTAKNFGGYSCWCKLTMADIRHQSWKTLQEEARVLCSSWGLNSSLQVWELKAGGSQWPGPGALHRWDSASHGTRPPAGSY